MKVTILALTLVTAMVAVGAEPSKSILQPVKPEAKSASTLPTQPSSGSVGTSSAASTTGTVEGFGSLRSRIFGAIDVRPSIDLYSPKQNSIRLESDVELGYKFTKDTSIMYEQDFYHTLRNTGVTTGNLAQGNVMIRDGFFKTKVNNIWNSGALSFGFENRVYLPTHEGKNALGMVTEIRNYFKLGIQATQSLSFVVMSVPIIHAYKRPMGAPGFANAVFEHRTYFVTELALGRWNISLPIILNSYRFRDAGGAANSGRTGHFLWINPEVMYSVTPNLALGLSYYSFNLLEANMPGDGVYDTSTGLGSLRLGEGLKRGVPQFAIRATL